MKRLIVVGSLLATVLTSCTIGPCGMNSCWSPNISAQLDLLPPTQYAPAETVYRYFLPDDQPSGSATNFAYCLLFGKSDLPVSSDFLSLLSYKHVRIMRGYYDIDFQNGVPKDKLSARGMVFLKLRSVTVRGEQGNAVLISSMPSKTTTCKLKLEKQQQSNSRPLLPAAVVPCRVNDGNDGYQILF
jgi:hypothetical protein